jgi:hypothetical protein
MKGEHRSIMDPGFRTPLLDCFRRGEVDREIRVLAARGALAPRAQEQLALLVFLVSDPDAEVALLANTTLDALPPAAVAKFIGRSEVGDEMRAFFVARGIQPIASTSSAKDDDEPLLETGAEEAMEDDGDEEKVRVVMSALSVPQRMKFALKGTRSQRAVLIRDPNKVIAAAVLSSPKLTETEVESFSRMANVSEETLRTIAMNRAWTRSYTVISGLVKNPKTPPAISLTMLTRLNERDVKGLMTDRNVPEALRLAARKVIAVNEARKQQ